MEVLRAHVHEAIVLRLVALQPPAPQALGLHVIQLHAQAPRQLTSVQSKP